MAEKDLTEARHAEFLRLFSTHSQRIYEFILTLVMRQADAEEIFQDTSLILWRKFDSYDPDGNFRAWACRIAYLEVLQLRRTSHRFQTFSEQALSLLADQALSHSESLEQRRVALESCLEKLPPRDREIIEQRYYHRHSPKEIAGLKECSVYSIYRALARVHTALLNCVNRQVTREESR